MKKLILKQELHLGKKHLKPGDEVDANKLPEGFAQTLVDRGDAAWQDLNATSAPSDADLAQIADSAKGLIANDEKATVKAVQTALSELGSEVKVSAKLIKEALAKFPSEDK